MLVENRRWDRVLNRLADVRDCALGCITGLALGYSAAFWLLVGVWK